MRVRVLFFGQLKDIVGVAQEEAELSEGARVEISSSATGEVPKLAEFRASIAASVNQEYANWGAPLARRRGGVSASGEWRPASSGRG